MAFDNWKLLRISCIFNIVYAFGEATEKLQGMTILMNLQVSYNLKFTEMHCSRLPTLINPATYYYY
jgi:hypothetical protein